MDKQKAVLLGQFLKSRREKMNPSEAGLPPGYGKRRTPGLRREEVAQLAHVSTTWYTWLEQGRASTPSRQVLDSVANALRLSKNEHLHMLHLASLELPNPAPAVQQLSPDIEKIIYELPYPAFIATDRTEVLSWNDSARRTIFDFPSVPEEDRCMAWLTFMNEGLRNCMPDWEEYAQYTAGVLRGRYEKNLTDLAFHRLIERLTSESPEFRELWSTHDIMDKTIKTIRLHHQEVGLLSFNINSFSQINGSGSVHCCVYIPTEGTDTSEKLQMLLSR
ncbi:Helix-turn-helix domain-containing protein [Paenibacillus catalpae]|uniref:Helix-turn-helix domain-containing protein n=1 Tax=Paenibacillus catalpae TaxID=1045775 RepID=A0A1I2FQU3_9BACL|nr:helix-turn-helix transcriptional regulator [Paenibacillus catalpae]SFF06831.1 Helix-turn-helix domain-containing protein [Paenibacillus catalpae]